MLVDAFFAVSQRVKNREEIRHPLTGDIRVLFYMEFKTAQCIEKILRERMNIGTGDAEREYFAMPIERVTGSELEEGKRPKNKEEKS